LPVETAPAFGPEETEPVAAPARPKFAELSEEPTGSPQFQHYAPESLSGARSQTTPDEYRSQPVVAPSPEADEERQRDLDTPAFMRRLQF